MHITDLKIRTYAGEGMKTILAREGDTTMCIISFMIFAIFKSNEESLKRNRDRRAWFRQYFSSFFKILFILLDLHRLNSSCKIKLASCANKMYMGWIKDVRNSESYHREKFLLQLAQRPKKEIYTIILYKSKILNTP